MDFYFTHYCQEVLNSVAIYIASVYEAFEEEIPTPIEELCVITKEKSDNDLSGEINDKFFTHHNTKLETLIKTGKEHTDKLERQKANMIKEMNELRKTITKLKKSGKNENNENEESSESISGNTSEIKTPRSEDMITIERLKRQNDDLEEKLKETKKRDKEDRTELQKRLSDLQAEVDDKNYKLTTLKDSLCEKFKVDIEKLRKSFEKQQKELEKNLISQKELEIENITKITEKQYQNKIVNLQNQLDTKSNLCVELEESIEKNQYHQNLEIKHENENRLKILKENKASFAIAFDDNTLKNTPRKMEEQVSLSLARTLNIGIKDIRLVSVNEDERLESDRQTKITIFLYELVSDGTKSNKSFNFPPLTCLNKLRVQIRDGSSLLYDLNPIYVGINIGSVFGFVYEKPVDEYYLLKREGIYFGQRQLLVTILKHPEHYYKIIAYDVATNEEFTLSLDTHDIIELASVPTISGRDPNSPPFLNDILENDVELSNVIMESLTLIRKEAQIFMV